MDGSFHSHRFGLELAESKYKALWDEIKDVIYNISDDDIIQKFTALNSKKATSNKSLAAAINQLLKERLVKKGWSPESPIFQDHSYQEERWRLDFAKKHISIEVAFNHGEAIAWNLIKPVLASELNHVEKAIQTDLGVVITAADDLKRRGGFDSAVGEYEKVLRYLKPFSTLLTVPIVVVGLHAPKSFYIKQQKGANGKIEGTITRTKE